MSKYVHQAGHAMTRRLLQLFDSWVDCAYLPGVLDWRACA